MPNWLMSSFLTALHNYLACVIGSIKMPSFNRNNGIIEKSSETIRMILTLSGITEIGTQLCVTESTENLVKNKKIYCRQN